MRNDGRDGDGVVSRTLTQRLRIRSSDPVMQAALAYLACDPDVSGPEPPESLVEVVPAGRHWRIIETGHGDKETLGVEDTLAELHGRVFERSLSDRPDAPILHAASLVRGGRRVLLVGRKGAGKTTLTLRLASRGFTLESDENIFITGAGVVARPRGCRIKEASLPLLPEIATAVEASPFIVDYRGARIFNFDPRTAGIRWSISEGPADAILLVRANHGGLSSLREVPTMAMVRGLMSEVALQPGQQVRALTHVARLASSSQRFDLSLGDVDEAIALVESLVPTGS